MVQLGAARFTQAMRLQGIHPGDIVLGSKGGRRFHAEVEKVERGLVHVNPITRGITWRQLSPRDVVGRWRKSRLPGVEDAPPVAKEQLSLAHLLDPAPDA